MWREENSYFCLWGITSHKQSILQYYHTYLYIPRRGRYTIKLVCGTYRAKKGSKDWTKKTEKYFQCKIVPAGALRVTANQRSHISRRGRVVSGESPGALSQVMGNTELTTRNRSVEFDDWWTLRMLRVMTFHTECSNLHRKSRPPSCHLCIKCPCTGQHSINYVI